MFFCNISVKCICGKTSDAYGEAGINDDTKNSHLRHLREINKFPLRKGGCSLVEKADGADVFLLHRTAKINHGVDGNTDYQQVTKNIVDGSFTFC